VQCGLNRPCGCLRARSVHLSRERNRLVPKPLVEPPSSLATLTSREASSTTTPIVWGAIRLGDGPKPRLRFDVDEARRRLGACFPKRGSESVVPPVVVPIRRRRGRAHLGTRLDLLPIRGARARGLRLDFLGHERPPYFSSRCEAVDQHPGLDRRGDVSSERAQAILAALEGSGRRRCGCASRRAEPARRAGGAASSRTRQRPW
jgi:hypothetical protein